MRTKWDKVQHFKYTKHWLAHPLWCLFSSTRPSIIIIHIHHQYRTTTNVWTAVLLDWVTRWWLQSLRGIFLSYSSEEVAMLTQIPVITFPYPLLRIRHLFTWHPLVVKELMFASYRQRTPELCKGCTKIAGTRLLWRARPRSNKRNCFLPSYSHRPRIKH